MDEGGSPLVGQAGVSKNRCGGSWQASNAFTTDGSGQFQVTPTCPSGNWDDKLTVTVNQTTREQNIILDPTFQLARVNANLVSCTGSITSSPGGTVAQGGGSWYTHGTTGPSGTVTFYTFPGSIKLRMSYNHHTQTLYPAIAAGTNEVDFQTTTLTLLFSGAIKSNMGGTWWYFDKPSMDLLPGTYNFWFDGNGPQGVVVAGCAQNLAALRVIDETGTGVAGAKATPAVGGSWMPTLPGQTDINGYLYGSLPTGTTKVKMVVNQGGMEKTSAEMVLSTTWIAELLRISLKDHAGAGITSGATLDQGGGFWYSWGALGVYRDIPVFPGSYKFRVSYNFTSEEKNPIAVVAGPGIQTQFFSTGQVFGSCITEYSTGAWRTFTDGMELMAGTYTFRYPSQLGTITSGGITSLTCP